MLFFCFRILRPPISKLTYTLFPYTTLFLAKDEDLARAVLVAKATPHLAAEMGAAIDAYRAPPTASLLMSQRQAIIQRENVAERVTLSKRRLKILNKKSAALEEEARLLNQTNINAETFKRCNNNKKKKKQ